MNAYRFNQIAMAVLGALLLFFGARTIINIAFEEHEEKPGYDVPGTEEKPGEQKPAGSDLAALLAKADAAHGAEVAKKCGLCHNFDKGGPNMIGPNLYGVLGRKVASHEGYDYSDALKAKGGNWDYELINKMITNPNEYVPGTKMAIFPGLPDAKDRADVLAFLRTKNDNPPPLPEVKPAETPAPGGEATTPAAPAGSDFMAALATADPKAGEADVALCKVCHTFNKGGTTLVGPNLYGVVGRKIASVEGFNYTPGLKAHEGDWTFDKLDAWLTNPAVFAPGTMMAFPGIPDTKKRADVIAYLNSNSDSPLPIPKAGSGGAAAPAATPESAAPAAAPAGAAPAAATPPAEAAPPPEAAPLGSRGSASSCGTLGGDAVGSGSRGSASRGGTFGRDATGSGSRGSASSRERASGGDATGSGSRGSTSRGGTFGRDSGRLRHPRRQSPPKLRQLPPPRPQPSEGDDYLSSQPQPVYPDGPPDAQ